MYTVYVLRSLRDGKLYTGYTNNLDRRLTEHNSGKTKSLQRRLPLELVYTEEYVTKEAAFLREAYLKSGRGREELKAILTHLVRDSRDSS